MIIQIFMIKKENINAIPARGQRMLFCGMILPVLKESYMRDDKFIEETENKALNYVEY